MVTIYNAISADGFVAHKDGSEDFIPDDAWEDFLEALAAHDVIVMGRKTYEAVQAYPAAMINSFESIPMKRFVMSQEKGFVTKKGYSVMSSLSVLPTSGESILITSGPSLNTAALQAGIIDRVMLNVVPVAIGEGIPVFNVKPVLVLISTDGRPTGRKFCTYRIENKM